MKKRLALMLAATVVVALVASAVAVAEGTFGIAASHTAVTYPHSTRLSVTFPTTESTSAAVLRLPAGASEWTTVSAEVTSSVVVKPRGTAAYKAVWNGTESDPVTVTVAARLTKPQIAKGGRKNGHVRIKGSIAPGHRSGKVTLSFYRTESVKRKGSPWRQAWVLHGTSIVGLKYKNSQLATWTTLWTPPQKGVWKVVVSHEDTAHVASSVHGFTSIR